MPDPYLDALEQLDQMRDRAFKAEAAIARVREVCRDPSRRMMATSHMHAERAQPPYPRPPWSSRSGPSGRSSAWVDLNAILDALEGASDD